MTTVSAQSYSFEDGLIPSNWSTNTGSFSIVANKYKIGTKSIRWNWMANSKITISNPFNIENASTNNSGGINVWVYNSTPSPTAKLVFSGVNSSSEVKCHIDFNLNFKGWRYLTAKFVTDMGHDKTPLSFITIQAPSADSGTLCFDYMVLPTRMQDSINSDAQFIVRQDPTIDDFQGVRSYGNFVATTNPSRKQIEAIDTIINRLDNWFLSKTLYPKTTEYNIRRKANLQWMRDGISLISKFDFKTDADGTVSAGSLFSDFTSNKLDQKTTKKFKEYHKLLLPVALDYRINGTASSKTALLNMYDWYNDQGWADGSGMGNMMYEKITVAGYIHSVFLMRNELGPERLAREVNTINWYSLLGSANMPFKHTGDNADMLRTMAMGKLYAAILQPDVNKRITALTALTQYYNNAYSPAPGYAETFKPDFSGYHHYGPYLGAYFTDALYAASLICYLLHDTPFALSDTTYSNLKQYLMTFRLYCGNYDVPSGANARFPDKTTMLHEILPAYAYVALSKSTPDAELLAVFNKYWKPTAEPVNKMISRAGIDITQKRTLGEIELCLTAAKLAPTAEKPIKSAFYMPYAGLLVNRGVTRLITVDGYSKYVAGFESVFPKDNLYGRYLHFGQIEYTSLADGRKNNAYNNNSWDWNRIPGTTSRHLTKKDLYYLTTGSHRVFGDQTFLGGAAINDSTSVFSFKLHDNMFDKSFYANKSVFCFGNVLICLGSNISNNSTNATTETTLLQQRLNEGESFKVNGKELDSNQLELSNPVISDNLGNSFIVKSGKVDVFKSDTLYSAIIDHGFAPKNQEYCYYMLIQSNKKQELKFLNKNTDPVRIIRQDSIAHIVNHKEADVYAYSIFNSEAALNDSWIKQVNTPSIVLIKILDKSNIQIVITDPDLRRPEFSGGSSISESTKSESFKYAITLNGLFQFQDKYPNATLTVDGNTTKIVFNTVEAKLYQFNLSKITN